MINAGVHYGPKDFPAQIYDIDGDGSLELLCVSRGKFLVLDGKTGSVKEEHALPDPEAHDCIIIANLSGNPHPSDIILKNRYEKLWALDRSFNVLWTHAGNVGHFPWAYDINGDGFDEVMAGYDMLDHNGKIMWSCRDLTDHADCLWTGDVNGDGKKEIVVGGGKDDVIVYDATKAVIFSGTEYDLTSTPSGKAIPQPRRLYSSTLYPGGDY